MPVREAGIFVYLPCLIKMIHKINNSFPVVAYVSRPFVPENREQRSGEKNGWELKTYTPPSLSQKPAFPA